jgi:hypothetical protein
MVALVTMDNMMKMDVMMNTIRVEEALATTHFQATHHQPVQESGECFLHLINTIVLPIEPRLHHFDIT